MYYVCHSDHDHDRTYVENITEYLTAHGVAHAIVELPEDGIRPHLTSCLRDDTIAVLGFNSQLDHSWLPSGNFVEAAARHSVPVIQWIMDHPSIRWPEFLASTWSNCRFVLNSRHAERYFQRYCLSYHRTAVVNIGPNWRSRMACWSRDTFRERPITCLIPMNLTRLGGSLEQARERITALDQSLVAVIEDAIAQARFDLDSPLENHLGAALTRRGCEPSKRELHALFHLVEAFIQDLRRRQILAVARDYPVLVQSEPAAAAVLEGGTATLAVNVDMPATLGRMPKCRAVLSVSAINDEIHHRTFDGLNAGCAVIIEANAIHREFFRHGDTALLFRYDDDSLRQCLDIVCHQPDRAFAIAQAGMALRDDPRLRFDGLHSLLDLAR